MGNTESVTDASVLDEPSQPYGMDEPYEPYEMDLMEMEPEDDCRNQSCMYFYASKESTLLFKSWKIDTDFEFWMAIGGIVTFGLLYEMVKSFRACLIMEAQANAALAENKPILLTDGDSRRRRNNEPEAVEFLQHILCTLFYCLEWTLFYLLLLVVIGFNVWNLIAAVTGVSAGYLMFGKGRVN